MPAVETDKLKVKARVFDPTRVKFMSVTNQPSKLSYTVDDKLALAGLVVTLTDDHGLTKVVTPAELTANGITADPKDGAVLKLVNDGKPVKLTRGNLTTVTDALQVKAKESSSEHGESGGSGSSGSTGGSGSSGSAGGSGSLPSPGSLPGGAGTGVNDDAPTTVDKGELSIQIDSAESDSKPGNAGAGDANAVENAPEVKQADAAVKQAADMLDDALAQAKRVATNPNATQAQVDAAVRRLVEARRVLADAKANAANVRAAVRIRVIKGMRSRGGTGTTGTSNAGVDNNAVNNAVENDPEVKQSQHKLQLKTSALKAQSEKRIGMIPKTGESASFAVLLAVLGFSIAGLAIFCKKKMMEGNK